MTLPAAEKLYPPIEILAKLPPKCERLTLKKPVLKPPPMFLRESFNFQCVSVDIEAIKQFLEEGKLATKVWFLTAAASIVDLNGMPALSTLDEDTIPDPFAESIEEEPVVSEIEEPEPLQEQPSMCRDEKKGLPPWGR